MNTGSQLPILAHAAAIRALVADRRRIILSAPPGTGKSTQVPQILLPESGRAIVLQPRRIAARNLAVRVAQERGEEVGGTVGYQVRFERASQEATRLLYATYGIFWQQLLQDPTVPDVAVVILDEFHERTLEADAVLAWVRTLQRTTRPDLVLVVMSATLDGAPLTSYLEAPLLEVDARLHPVSIEYLPPNPQEPPWTHAVRAFRMLVAQGLDGSVLAFMPGGGEIRRTAENLEPIARSLGWRVLELSGAQSLEDQQRALSLPARERCVIVATNIAETSLTIPGVVAVIDSGLARQAAYDPYRDLDTLHLGWISRQNAAQRAGRAGRLCPGRCVRLWSRSHETGMPEALAPEIQRLDLSRLALACSALPEVPEWLTAPDPERWKQAHDRLTGLGAVGSNGRITATGRRLLRFPLPPALARVLAAAQEGAVVTLCAAMIAILEAADRRSISDEGDLYTLGLALVREAKGRRPERDVVETYRQLLRLAYPSRADTDNALAAAEPGSALDTERRRAVTGAWLSAFGSRLAFRRDKAFELADGRKGLVSAGQPASSLLLALELHEVGGIGRNRQVSIPLYLPCEPDWLEAGVEPVTVCEWDPDRQRVVQTREWRSGGQTVRCEALRAADWDARLAEEMLVEKLLAGEARLEARDEDVEQWILRIRTAARVWPEAKVPVLEAEDWRVVYHEVCAGKASPRDIDKSALLTVLQEYVGWDVWARLEQAAPTRYRLPSGRQARITYFADAPPELSARLGDLIGLQGTMQLFEGRVQVLFDILAPNMRTVQKTHDLSGFWANTYPEIKRELQRRYPKHPWP